MASFSAPSHIGALLVDEQAYTLESRTHDHNRCAGVRRRRRC